MNIHIQFITLEFSEFSFAFPKAHTGKNGMQSSINIGE